MIKFYAGVGLAIGDPREKVCIGRCDKSRTCGVDCILDGFQKGGACAGEIEQFSFCCCNI